MKLMIVDDSGVIRNKIARGAAAKQFVVVGMARDGEVDFTRFSRHMIMSKLKRSEANEPHTLYSRI